MRPRFIGIVVLLLLLSVLPGIPLFAQGPEPSLPTVELRDPQGNVVGEADFFLRSRAGRTVLGVRTEGFDPTRQRLTITNVGVCEAPGFETAGDEILNLSRVDFERDEDARGEEFFGVVSGVDTERLFDASGSALVLHARGTARSDIIGCGVITPSVAQAQAEEERTAETVSEIPPEVEANQGQWPLANKDYQNSRATLDSTITSDNVSNLGVAWTFPIPGQATYGSGASNPLILNDTVYFQDLESNVFALDLIDGEVIWRQMYNDPVVGPNGPGVGYGKVFVASGVNELAALDIETGEELWVTNVGEQPTGSFQPYAYDGLAYFTTVAGVVAEEAQAPYRGYAAGQSGHILAVAQDTGEIIWDFQVVTEDFWGHPEVNSGGGVWYPPAIDTLTGTTFWATGNPAPFPGTVSWPNATSRDDVENLYTNSILALTHEEGELLWYNHINPNDLFDLDVQVPPILAVVDNREIVIGAGKLGEVFALDRQTGETLWRTKVGKHMNDELTRLPLDTPILVYPGILGGVETPMAHIDGIIYAAVNNLPTEHTATGWGATTGTEALANASEHTAIGEGTSEVVAVDADTGAILWSHELPVDNYSGATVVNDLVFTADFNGVIYALDRMTGEEVWTWQAPAGINAWPAVSGDTIVWPAGVGENPVLIALRLGAEQATPTPTPEAEEMPEATPTPEETPEATPTPEEMAATRTPMAQQEAVEVAEILQNPDQFAQQTVAIRGEVQETIDRRVIRLQQDGEEIVVFTPRRLAREPQPGEFLRVQGTPRGFERPELEEEIDYDISDELAQELEGQPVIVAESVRARRQMVTPTPEGAEATPTPQATRMPTPQAEETPEATPTPEAEETPTATPTPAEGAQAEQQPPVQVVAENIEFVIPEDNEVTVAAGSHVVMEFTNRDRVPHNWAAYRSSDAAEEIFVGEIITGPDNTITYEFDAPTEPGNYYFQCDVHPTTMTGDFIVEEAGS